MLNSAAIASFSSRSYKWAKKSLATRSPLDDRLRRRCSASARIEAVFVIPPPWLRSPNAVARHKAEESSEDDADDSLDSSDHPHPIIGSLKPGKLGGREGTKTVD